MARASENPSAAVDSNSELPPTPPAASVPPSPYPPYAPYAPNPPYLYGPAAPKTNVLAIVSLVTSLAALLIGISAIAGVITGHIALSQIKRTGEGGRGLALAGVIVGYSLIGIGVLLIIAYVIIIVFAIAAAGTAGSFSTTNSG